MIGLLVTMVPNLTNVLIKHRFSADAFLGAFEQLEVKLYQVLARLIPSEMLIYLKKGFNLYIYWATAVNCPYVGSE